MTAVTEDEQIEHDVEAEPLVLAAEGVQVGRRLPTVEIVAYSGGVMAVPGWGDVIIDLAGLDVAAGEVAILADHDAKRTGVIGHGSTSVEGGKLIVRGRVSGDSAAAREVVRAAQNGFPWQASVGVQPVETRHLRPGEAIQINNQTVTTPKGGAALIVRGRLREVSITALGCDADTHVRIAAMRQKGFTPMETVKEPPESTDTIATEERSEMTEAERLEQIEAAYQQHDRSGGNERVQAVRAQAIEESWPPNKAEVEMLRAARPLASDLSVRRDTVGASPDKMLEAALLTYMGKPELGADDLGPYAMARAERFAATGLLDVCRAALIAEGVGVPSGRMAMVKAALSTYSLPVALGNVANKVMLDAYKETPASWRSFCSVRSVSDFKTHTAVRPTFTGQLEQVAPGGELHHGGVAEWTTEYAVDTFGKLISIDRRDIINDDLSIFHETAAALGRSAMRKVSDLIYEVLLSNPGNFFSIGNGNLITGAESALTMDGLSKAITAMRTQRDDEGNDLDLKPAVLLVGPELETVARALLESEYIQAQVDGPTGNSLRRAVQLEVEPRLSNTPKFGSDASDTHWFLLASPSNSPQIVAFLNGRQQPTTEFFGIDQNVNRLAVAWRVYHDFGSAMCDPRAAVRSVGE
ncbi:hypothetical protein HED60_21430 [Planctomycetales bacterium ZRK34]|nr:hypothetical protein HED60_21430 [Planctomycetales bacterium ZRK34]